MDRAPSPAEHRDGTCPTGPVRSGHRLLILIARNDEAFDPLVTGLLDVGITGATVVDSRGLSALLRDEMPIFAGLASLLPRSTGSKVVVSITTADRIEALGRFLGQMREDLRPLGATIPVEHVFGLWPAPGAEAQ
jgi:nitrogen regulatory protein P-II 1